MESRDIGRSTGLGLAAAVLLSLDVEVTFVHSFWHLKRNRKNLRLIFFNTSPVRVIRQLAVWNYSQSNRDDLDR